MGGKKVISSFSVLLIMAVTAIVGIAMASMLKIQYVPAASERSLTVEYSMPGASARVIEAEITSKIEGVLSNISNCSGVSSVSSDNAGSVTVNISKRADIDLARFEIATQIRNIYPSLPESCTYPSISFSSLGNQTRPAITYNIKSTLPSKEIASFAEKELTYPISMIDGVTSTDLYGWTPYEWVITFDAEKAQSLGITASDISSAWDEYYSDYSVGSAVDADGHMFNVRLKTASGKDFGDIPVRKVGDRIVYLSDIASCSYQESIPDSYYRLNGLNTLILSVEVASDANMLKAVSQIREKMEDLQRSFPEEISVSVGYDYSEYMSEELDKIYFRTSLCLLILLLFVFIFNRSWRYMLVIAITLAVNILAAIAFYYLFGLNIHIYTLAGITVSLGIIIDNSIVMIDHYSKYRTRTVFPALLSAVLTTVAALLAVFLLPEQDKANLSDFSWVIVINLAVSLAVAYLFVPALLDYIHIDRSQNSFSSRRLRKVAGWNRWYKRYISWGLNHKWLYVLLLILFFGIPTCVLPTKFGDEKKSPLKGYEKVLNKIVGWKPYAENKTALDKLWGGSFAMFYDALGRADFYREPSRPLLIVKAAMPEGCTVQQTNEVIREMENYLASFEEIELFETMIISYDDGEIGVYFKPEYEHTAFPSQLKSQVTSMAINFGGANWGVYGIDDNSFNNHINTRFKDSGISLSGYNYDQLISYGDSLIARLGTNKRVSEPEIWGRGFSAPITEFSIQYDFASLANSGVSPYKYYTALSSPLFNSRLGYVLEDNTYTEVRMSSSDKDILDKWHIENTGVEVDSSKVKLSAVGSITKKQSGIAIEKEDQSYEISVRYDFLGSNKLSQKVMDEAIDYMNSEVLPVGFKAFRAGYGGWFDEEKEKYAGLILLVIAAIFVICSIQFESLRLPLAVILMIPVSFVGLFLVFGLTNFTFDKGGFAAFIMLSGVAVNAGIYLISSWQRDFRRGGLSIDQYIRAFNNKIWPIFLTIVSTVLGLIPFLFDGPSEVFWFAFAVGTIGGLLFSIIAFVFFLPIFSIKKSRLEYLA